LPGVIVVATPTTLIRLNPNLADPGEGSLKFIPIAMSSSGKEYLDVLGSRNSKEYLTTFDAKSDEGYARLVPGASGGLCLDAQESGSTR